MNVYFLGMIISMIVYIALGIIISKNVKGANDFFVAGRQAPTLLIVGSLVASYCSTGLFMGDVGEAYAGFFAPFIITVMMQIGGYLLGSVFFGKYLRRSEALTIPEFFGKRYNSKHLQKLAAITAIITMTVYLLSVMQGIGTLMNYVTGIDYKICIVMALITFAILTVTSGSKGVLITDTIMFGIFTIASLILVVIVVGKMGGVYQAVADVTAKNPTLLSWSGDLSHLYPTGAENMVWAVMTGLTWAAVCAVGPWQSSRYLMAKDEHVVVRSSVYAAIGVGALEFLIPFTGVLLNKYSDYIQGPTVSMIWAAMNMVPVIIGVVVLTGVLAAGISSATTFLSLIGASVSNDLLFAESDNKKVLFGRIAIIVVCVVVLLLAIFNPPQIYAVLLLSGTVVVCSWFPVCVASIWSKRVTKAGAYFGMLFGFIGCAAMKIIAYAFNITLPLYLDSFVVGLVLGILAMIIVSACTKVTDEENEKRAKLFVAPVDDADAIEIAKTKRTVLSFTFIGIGVAVVLLVLWVIPYYLSL